MTSSNSSSSNSSSSSKRDDEQRRQELKRAYPGFPQRFQEAFRSDDRRTIAAKLKCSVVAVGNYLNQIRLPGRDTLTRISELTGCSIHWLLTGNGEKFVKNEINSSSIKAEDSNSSGKETDKDSDSGSAIHNNQTNNQSDNQ